MGCFCFSVMSMNDQTINFPISVCTAVCMQIAAALKYGIVAKDDTSN